MLSTVNTVSADSSIIYVNDSGGNDSWNGEAALWDGSTLFGPKKSIKNATGTVTDSGTVNIADGNYTGVNNTNILIDKNMAITGQSKEGTIINGANTARIFIIQGGCNVTLQNLTITNGKADAGGAIYNYGNLTLNGCNLTGNTATTYYSGGGGAIHNSYGNLIINNSIFTGNTAVWGGAISGGGTFTIINSDFTNNYVNYGNGGVIFNNLGILNVINSTFIDNNAYGIGCGGAIHNYQGTSNITNCTFTSNFAYNGGAIFNENGILTADNSNFTGNGAQGGAIYNTGTAIINFNRIVGNIWGSDVYNGAGTMDLNNNWWGSNLGPGNRVQGLTVNEWLVLTITTNPAIIKNREISIITVDLTHDNGILSDPTHPELYYHDPTIGCVPDGIPVTFTTTLGTVGMQSSIVNGIAQTTLNSGLVAGAADVSTVVDSQTVHTLVIIRDTIPPIISSINPANNVKINIANKVITVTFSEPIQTGSAYDGISVTGSSGTIPITKNISGNVLTLIPTSNYADGNYNVNIPVNAVTDLAGNGLAAAFSSVFTVDTIPPTVNATPAGGSYYNSLNAALNAADNLDPNPVIYYTLDGSDPTKNSALYSGPISIATSKVLKFFAIDTAGNQSPIKTEQYSIYAWTPYSYQVTVPYRLSNKKYRIKYRVAYTVKKKVRKKWVLVTKYKWKYKWDYRYGYRTETRWDYRWQLT